MGPLKVSSNGRYFTEADGTPFFWHGDTQWELFRALTLEEAGMVLRQRQRLGFTAIQVMLTGVGDGTKPNFAGEKPWLADDPATPNEAYFRNVDAVVELARELDLTLVVGIFHQLQVSLITPANARQYARWIAQRYQNAPNMVWSMYPAATQEFIPVCRELAAGLQAGDGGAHLITVHPDPSPASSSFIHGDTWLSFNSIQPWRWVELIYPMVTADYQMQPVKPTIMAEAAYEAGTEYSFEVTPLWIRRQAYYSYLAGGHHSYGHNDSWRMLPTWKQALDAPGAAQLSVLKRAFQERKEWWELIPDQALFAGGGNTEGTILNLAARHKDGRWAMVYMAEPATVSLHMDRIAGGDRVEAFWLDPRTGGTTAADRFANSGVQAFSTPEGWEDALLILEAATD